MLNIANINVTVFGIKLPFTLMTHINNTHINQTLMNFLHDNTGLLNITFIKRRQTPNSMARYQCMLTQKQKSRNHHLQ